MKTEHDSYLTSYIQRSKIEDEILKIALKFELDRRIYHYGNHFKNNTEADSKKSMMKSLIRFWIFKIKIFLNNLKKLKTDGNLIVSSTYISANVRMDGGKLNTTAPPWLPSLKGQNCFSLSLFSKCNNVQVALEKLNFNELISDKFFKQFEDLKNELIIYYSNKKIVGAIFPNDIGFFEVISIKILKQLNKKTFLYLHGIPGAYYPDIYSKSDYLLVWGEKCKKHFVDRGMSEDKIFIVGHPKSQSFLDIELRSDLNNVLVLGNAVPGAQGGDVPVLWDRSTLIFYCYQIQDVLKKLGVKKVTLRPHPSENVEWYKKFIDLEFFKIDNSPYLETSIKKSSLVIGPSSTSAFEALGWGVNYIVFEPFYEEDSYLTHKLVPPFDKTDKRLVVCTSTDELLDCLVENRRSEVDIVEDYMSKNYILEDVVLRILG